MWAQWGSTELLMRRFSHFWLVDCYILIISSAENSQLGGVFFYTASGLCSSSSTSTCQFYFLWINLKFYHGNRGMGKNLKTTPMSLSVCLCAYLGHVSGYTVPSSLKFYSVVRTIKLPEENCSVALRCSRLHWRDQTGTHLHHQRRTWR